MVRINVLDNQAEKYQKSTGTATHFRVLSLKMSRDVCCLQPKHSHAPDSPSLQYLLWFPAHRMQLAARIHQRWPHLPRAREMSEPFLAGAIRSFKSMRLELVRLGFGPFEDWEFITSGMHAVLGFARH